MLGRKRPSPSGQEEPSRLPATEEDQDTGNDSAVAIHRPMTIISKSNHKQGKYVSDWASEFPWVYPSGDKKGMYMYCRLCTCFNTRNERNGSAIFSSTPCVSLRKNVLVRQADSYMHT